MKKLDKTARITRGLAFLATSVLVLAACSILWSVVQLGLARRGGVYASPQAAVQAIAERHYRGLSKIDFGHAGPNAFDGSDPHVWYVMFTIYAESHADGTPLYHGKSYEQGGHFYLHVKDGWVMMPEGAFPVLIGFWMKVLNLAG